MTRNKNERREELTTQNQKSQPAIGISRTKRWHRAQKMGLHPPIEVLAILMKYSRADDEGADKLAKGKGKGKGVEGGAGSGSGSGSGGGSGSIERAYVDYLMGSSRVVFEGGE